MNLALTIGLLSFSKAQTDKALLHQEALAPIAASKPQLIVLKYRSKGISTYIQERMSKQTAWTGTINKGNTTTKISREAFNVMFAPYGN